MTRKELLSWAEETVKHIFHGHGHTQTFKGQIVGFKSMKFPMIKIHYDHDPEYAEKQDWTLITSLPPIDWHFQIDDEVEITIKLHEKKGKDTD